MIQQTSFLGIPLRTLRQRRALVIAYYVLLLFILAIGLYRQQIVIYGWLAQTITLGGFFGGIRAEGVIKPYDESMPHPGESGVQQLNLNGFRPFSTRHLLDERERHERDQAHYTAYRILRWVFPAVALAFVVFEHEAPHLALAASLNLLWVLTVFILSLPQSVILWTEPEPLPNSQLTLVSSRS